MKSVSNDGEEIFDAPEISRRIDAEKARQMGRHEVGFVVETYYELQECRKRAANRERALEASGEPNTLMATYRHHYEVVEGRTQGLLRAWAGRDPLSSWAMRVVGIGPVIAAGLAAHIDMSRASSPSAVWRFAGLDPTSFWVGKKGAADVVEEVLASCGGDCEQAVLLIAKRIGMRPESVRRFAVTNKEGAVRPLNRANLEKAAARRPWNEALKVLCWKLGDSFVKVSGNPKSLYGRLYRERKALEVERSESGQFAELAAKTLAEKKFSSGTPTRKAYEEGHLPDGRLDLRARRIAVKTFLVHYWTKAWMLAHPGERPPQPWIIAHGGHVDLIPPEVPYDDEEGLAGSRATG